MTLCHKKRFLDQEGKFFRPDHFVPLGFGKRVCMGEPLVKAELFIFFVALVQKIRWVSAPVENSPGIRFSVVEGKEPNPKNYSIGITRVPDSYTVQIHART